VVDDAAALVVRIIGVAVVRRAVSDDRLQRRRAASRNLKGAESAPGEALHSHRAAAPRLGGDPFDHLDAVILLLLHILIERLAVRVAPAAYVEPLSGIAVAVIERQS